MMENKEIKTVYTQDMYDDLVSYEGIDVTKLLEDALLEELEKVKMQEKIDERNDTLDELIGDDLPMCRRDRRAEERHRKKYNLDEDTKED